MKDLVVMLRRRLPLIACLVALMLGSFIATEVPPVAARNRESPRISLIAYACPPGMTERTLVSVDCAPLTSGFNVEIMSIEGTQGTITIDSAEQNGNIFRWEVTPSNAEIDNWGIRQKGFPPGATTYLIQGNSVVRKVTNLYDYRFTTGENNLNADLFLFVFFEQGGGVIIPPTSEEQPAETAATQSETSTAPSTASPETASPDAATSDPASSDGATGNVQSREITTPVETRTIVRGPAPMRLAADSRASIVDILSIGDEVGILSGPVTAGNSSWYEVESAHGAFGWLEASAFETDDASTTATTSTNTGISTSATTLEARPFSAGDRVIVNDPPLQLRAGAGLDGDVISALPEGQLLQIDGESVEADGLTWYPVTLLPAGEPGGFVADGFMEEAGFLPGDAVAVTEPSANLRSEPSIAARILLEIPQGPAGTILSGPQEAEGYSWYEVELYSGQSGWMAGSMLGLANSSESTVIPGMFRVGSWVTVIDPPINLRVAAGIDAEAIEALELGDMLVVLGAPVEADGYTWYLVEVAGLQGYVAGEFLGGGFMPGESVRVFDGPVYLRTGPDIGSDIVIGLEQDQVVTVVSPAPLIGGDYLWIQVMTADGSAGYVATEFIEPA